MALIHCPECNYELSSKAKNCPNCGYPISSKDVINASVDKQEQRFHDNKKIIIPIALIIVVLCVFTILHSKDSKDPFEKYYSYLGQEKSVLEKQDFEYGEISETVSCYSKPDIEIWGQLGDVNLYIGQDDKINLFLWSTPSNLSKEEREKIINNLDKMYGKHEKVESLCVWKEFKNTSVSVVEGAEDNLIVAFTLTDDK